ncbi:hypothetical protein ATJ93_2926 [Halopiger aswanensis]|uniref:IclR-like helix-turn-helix domain-containing protein n=2 Tax=Halopiger aswanensis TaxID=148449 RepID=A0A419WCS6_9EURY|nr:hypothetical protein ATJ93_2926 [Halopiger aswanensis]
MRLLPAVTLALTVLLATAAFGPVAVASTASTTGADDHTPTTIDRSLLQSLPIDQSTADTTQFQSQQPIIQEQEPLPAADPKQIIRLNVSEKGDVRWTIESRFIVTGEDDIETLEEYADAIRRGDEDTRYDAQLFEPYVSQAEASTGREMTIENAKLADPEFRTLDEEHASTEGDEETQIGVIAYSFTWTNFASVDGDRIYFGDAFQATDEENEVWLSLYDGQRLVVETPQNYALETPSSLSWDGPHQFEASELEIVFLRGSTGPSSPVPSSVWLVGLIGVILIAAGLGGYLAYRYAQRSESIGIPLDPGRVTDEITVRRPEDQVTSDSAATDPETSDSAHRNDTGSPEPPSTQFEYEESDDDIDPELLSDEERVHRMLKRNGGRMKQATIVKETGWSNAKVSQLLSQMDDDGEIEKLRIGRENLITLPEVDPTEVD